MRTKALLLTAAIGAAGIATSMAQVYSVNAVGYVNVTIPIVGNPCYAILANPLNGTNNNIATVLPNVPSGTQLLRFNSLTGNFMDPETFYGLPGLAWDPGTANLNPGEAFFLVLDPAVSPNPTTVTFVGEVSQGNLTNNIPTGYSLRSSIVPQSGALQTVLGFSPVSGDQVFQWNNALTPPAYDIYTYYGLPGLLWDPSEPNLQVGQGAFIFNASGAAYTWGRSFSVN